MSKPPPVPSRMQERLDFFAQIEITADEDVLVLQARDISLGGLAVEIGAGEAEKLLFGAKVGVYVDIGVDSDGQKLTLTSKARVAHRREPAADRPGVVGLSWDANDAFVRASAERIMHKLRRSRQTKLGFAVDE